MNARVKLLTPMRNGSEKTTSTSVQDWIQTCLEHGGIESHIKKLQKLAAILGSSLLEKNPILLSGVAEAIDSEGYDHEIENT